MNPTLAPAAAQLRLEDLNPSRVAGLVALALSNPDALGAIASASYRHANGFTKIVLVDGPEKLRLHLWRAWTRFNENIHTHRWDLVSRILHGTMHEERYEVSDGRPATHEMYASSPRQGSSIEVSTAFRACRVELVESRSFSPGDMYESRQGEWHRTSIDNPPEAVLTACITSAPKWECAYVVHPLGTEVPSSVASPSVTVEEIEADLRFILDLIRP